MSITDEILRTIKKAKLNGKQLLNNDVLQILKATRTISANKQLIDSLIFFHTTYKIETNKNLTKRENQIIQLIGVGKNTNAIANQFNLSISTVETHRKNIIKKLGLIGKGKLLEYAILYNLQQNEEIK